MAFQDINNFTDNILNTQKQVLDTVVENTKKLTNGNTVLNETIEKGSEWYKNWLEGQKNIFSKTTAQATNTAETVKETVASATETVKENASKINDFTENWFKAQVNMAKQMWDMNQEWLKNLGSANGATANPFVNNPFTQTNPFTQNNPFMQNNPFTAWQNAMGGNNNNMWANWMNQSQNMNPFNQDAYKKATENANNLYTQYYNLLNNSFGELQKSFQNGTIQDAYKGMINIGEGFTKFAQMWEPMLKSIQDKTFNMDVYKQYMNPSVYKEMMDKFFTFLPGNGGEYMKNMTTMMQDGMKQMSDAGMNGFGNMKNMMNIPGFNQSQMFGNMLEGYNKWYSSMNEAAAPFTKMMTQNEQTKAMSEWNEITNRIMVYNIKNAELQYMIYNQGQKVMDALAENTMKKVQEGKEVNSLISLYQEWLGISDKTFVALFESDEYSKLMAEVVALKAKLQMDIDKQMEKGLKNIPVATRSEMDEVYKTIYDLKKQVKDLERKLNSEPTAKETVEEKPAAAKATKKA
jgi:hypothetical protein